MALLLVSGLSATSYVLPAPVFAPARATFPKMLHEGELAPTEYDQQRSRVVNIYDPSICQAHLSGPHGVGVESTWRPHDGEHEGWGQPMLAGLSKKQVMERVKMAQKKDPIYSPDGAKHDGLDKI